LNTPGVVASSDHDGDGRVDIVGISTSPEGVASIQWAGSDGTTDPRAFIVGLPVDAMFSGKLVR
jgi:hypothetical protein